MTLQEKIVVASGEFNTLTPKEIKFLNKCRAKGDWLIVGIHSDTYMYHKYGTIESDYLERIELLQTVKCVDEVFRFNDIDGTSCNLLKIVKLCYPQSEITYVSECDMHNMPETRIKGINFEVLSKE